MSTAGVRVAVLHLQEVRTMIIWYLLGGDTQQELVDYQRRYFRRNLKIPDRPVENIESVEEIARLMVEVVEVKA
jgi:hypothetical protein